MRTLSKLYDEWENTYLRDSRRIQQDFAPGSTEPMVVLVTENRTQREKYILRFSWVWDTLNMKSLRETAEIPTTQLNIWNLVKKEGVNMYTCGLSPSLKIAFEVVAINEISKEDTYMKRIEFEEGTLRTTTIQGKVKRREAAQKTGSKDQKGQNKRMMMGGG